MHTPIAYLVICLALLVTTTANAGDIVTAADAPEKGTLDPGSVAAGKLLDTTYTGQVKEVTAAASEQAVKSVPVQVLISNVTDKIGDKIAFHMLVTEGVLKPNSTFKIGDGQLFRIIPNTGGRWKDRLIYSQRLSKEGIDLAREANLEEVGTKELKKIKLFKPKEARVMQKRLEGTFEAINLGYEIFKIHNDETLTPEEQQRRIITETVASEVGILVSKAISIAAEAGKYSTTASLGVGVVGAVALGQLKNAVYEYWDMCKEIEQSIQDEENAANELKRMGFTKMMEIQKLVEKGDLIQAKYMTQDLRNWCQDRALNDVKGMWDMVKLCRGMERDISTTIDQIALLKEQQKQAEIDRYNLEIARYFREFEERRKREEELAKIFSIEAMASKDILAIGEPTTITIRALTGTPPFTLGDPLSGTFDMDNPYVLELPGQNKRGIYGLTVTATDAAGHVRKTKLTLKVIDDAQDSDENMPGETGSSIVMENPASGIALLKGFDFPYSSYTCINLKTLKTIGHKDFVFRDRNTAKQEAQQLLSNGYKYFERIKGKEPEPTISYCALPDGPYTRYEIHVDNRSTLRATKETGTYMSGLLHGETIIYDYDWTNDKSRRIEIIHYTNGKKHGITSKWYDNGQLEYTREYEHDIPHGQWQRWEPDGKPVKVENYKQGVKDGREQFYSLGVLETEIIWKDGTQHGLMRKYDKYKGALVSEHTYEKGLLNGPWRQYFDDGKSISIEGQYEDNKPVGVKTEYYDDGSIHMKTQYENGEKINIKYYTRNGENYKTIDYRK